MTPGTRHRDEAHGSASRWRPGARHARTVVALRYVIVLFWLGATVAALQLPGMSQGGGSGDLEGFVPTNSRAVATELASIEAFGFPLFARTVVVQRDPEGLSPYTQAEAVLNAVALNQLGPGYHVILGALPVTNTLGLFPSSSERGTTALTYVFTRPERSFSSQARAVERFAEHRLAEPDDSFVGLTGTIPARVAQGRILHDALPAMETATVAAIVLIVAVSFRSIVAPVVALTAAVVAYLLATRLAGVVGRELGVPIPAELEPLILALLLGVVTDYVIFFLTGMRHELARGRDKQEAARRATGAYAPIVAVAGLTVAAGSSAMVVAESAFFRAFGPAMALTVVVSLVVSLTLVPALLAILGRFLYWPSHPAAASAGTAGGPRVPSTALRWLTWRPAAAVTTLFAVGALAVAAYPLLDLRLGMPLVASLPADAEPRAAAQAASEGFAPGIRSPTVVLLQEPGLAGERESLARLGDLLVEQPGVAGVIGPGDLVPELERGILTSDDGDSARYLVILEEQPLTSAAIADLTALDAALPRLQVRAGLSGAETGIAGDTAVATELITAARSDLGRITVAALLVNFLILVVFLRSLVAPVYLLVCNVLALAAALGTTTYVFQEMLGHGGLTFYVPFAAAVLLLSLGSDYNIFAVGHVWRKARRLPIRRAVVEAGPETTHAITAAGITLAASFGMLALVPLRPFRELACAMAVGIVLDAVIVRSLLVPSLLSLVGRASGWPWARLAKRSPSVSQSSGGTHEQQP